MESKNEKFQNHKKMLFHVNYTFKFVPKFFNVNYQTFYLFLINLILDM